MLTALWAYGLATMHRHTRTPSAPMADSVALERRLTPCLADYRPATGQSGAIHESSTTMRCSAHVMALYHAPMGQNPPQMAQYRPAYSDIFNRGAAFRYLGRTGGLLTENGKNFPFTPF